MPLQPYRSYVKGLRLLKFIWAKRMNSDGDLPVHIGQSSAGAFDFLPDSGIILLSGDRLITLLLKRKLVHWRMR